MDDNQTTTGTEETTENTPTTGSEEKSEGKMYTQKEIDEMIEKRLARERKKFKDNQEAQQATASTTEKATETKKTETTPEDDSQGDSTAVIDSTEAGILEDAQTQAAAIIADANRIKINALAQSAATKLSVNPDYIADLVTLAKGDLDAIEVKEDGTVDDKLITAALEKVLERVPVFKAVENSLGKGGFRVGADSSENSSAWGGSNSRNTTGEQKRWNKTNRM